MKSKRILYVSSELSPYLPQTGIAQASLEVPRLMQEAGNEVRIFMPKYGVINERRHQLHEVIRLSGMNLVINDVDQPLIIKVASIPKERLQVYFIDNDEYFKDRGLYGDEATPVYSDNDERAIFFAKGVLETVKKLNWSPDIIHVGGYLSYILPLYVKTQYKDDPAYAETKIVTSLYGDAYPGMLGADTYTKVIFDGIDEPLLQDANYENLTKTCLKYSDGVVICSPEVSSGVLEEAKKRNLPTVTTDAGCVDAQRINDEVYLKLIF